VHPDPDRLFDQADALISNHQDETDLRRAVSAAYYGVFHFTLRALADWIVGQANRSTNRYGLVYRSVDHKVLRALCDQFRGANLNAAIQPFDARAARGFFDSPSLQNEVALWPPGYAGPAAVFSLNDRQWNTREDSASTVGEWPPGTDPHPSQDARAGQDRRPADGHLGRGRLRRSRWRNPRRAHLSGAYPGRMAVALVPADRAGGSIRIVASRARWRRPRLSSRSATGR
jgi:hypothetical protein